MRRFLVIGLVILLAACGKKIEGTYSANPTGIPQQKFSLTFKPDGTTQMTIGGTTIPVEVPFKQSGDKITIQGIQGPIEVPILENGQLLFEGIRLTKETAGGQNPQVASAAQPAPKAPEPAMQAVPPAAPIASAAIAQAPQATAPEEPKVVELKPSFDCSKAATFAEKSVCSEPVLGKLDGALGRNYEFMSAADLGDGAKHNLKTTQRQWVAERNKCTTTACLEKAYRVRIDAVCEYPVISGLHPNCIEQENVR
jgi:uncharacterized protein YecT (DUF1311 family)